MNDGGMTPERWAHIETVFARALELAPEQRARFVAAECGDDVALRHEVESLLAEHERDPAFLDAVPWAADFLTGEETPTQIGPYRIVNLLGRGGMGQVYLAEREAPGFKQRVAVKVMLQGMDTEDLLARFRTERQIMASLNHPNIARLLDVGATEHGLPYFVMEYIDGVPLLEYCDVMQLNVAQRVRLFRKVCDAVDGAHRGLIVHRDLKPHNILVTADGAPKLLDFGIAKMLDAKQGVSSSSVTRTDVRLLTPNYSSPEQIRGEPITTGCDVFALGVLLYELLTGQHPFGGAGTPRAELIRRILASQPAPPSAVVDMAAAATRRVSVRQLRRQLAGDLDTIILKAMRAELELRYPSVQALSDDLERHLDGRPVRAHAASAGYRLHRFIRRNRVAAGAAAALVLLSLIASTVTLYQSGRVRVETARVQRERDKALQVRGFLLEMFGTTGPDQPTGDSVTARQLLDRRAASLDASYAGDDDMRAEMMYVLAEGYEKLGLFDEAESLARGALDLRRSLSGGSQADVVASLNLVGWILHQRRQLDEAEALLREAVALGRSVFRPPGDAALARALNDLGVVREARRDLDEAAALYRESLTMRRSVFGDQHIGVAATTSNLAVVLYRRRELDAAVAMADTALALFRRVLGPDHQRTMIVQNNLAAMHSARGDRAGSARQQRDILARRTRLLGPRHPLVAFSMSMLASDLSALGETVEAERLLRNAIAIQETSAGAARDNLAATLQVLGDLEHKRGRYTEAVAHFQRALRIYREVHGDKHENVAGSLARLAVAYEQLGNAAAAENAHRDAVRVIANAAGKTHLRAIGSQLELIEFLVRHRRDDAARAQLRDAEITLASLADTAAAPLKERARKLRAATGG